jgi:NADH-quinone oxidoreductase subunit D
MGVYLKSDGSETAYRCRFRSPSFVNLQALPALVKGHLIADIVTLIGSIDIVLGCVDR